MLTPEYELQLFSQGYKRVIGIDEVGRGCWAGPVAIGAYVHTPTSIFIDKVNDSKKLSLKQRETIFAQLPPDVYQIRYGESSEIDKLGISNVIKHIIASLVQDYQSGSTFFLIDGYFNVNFGDNTMQVIKGDAKHYAIALGAIAAKVQRDRLMSNLSDKYSHYEFAQHKGYGTAKHTQAILKYGLSDMHRISFQLPTAVNRGD